MPPDPPNGIITQYLVQYRRLVDSRLTEVNTPATDLTYTVTGLMIATEYRFRVRAVTVVGVGDRSNIVDVFVGKLKIYQVCKNQQCPCIKISTSICSQL